MTIQKVKAVAAMQTRLGRWILVLPAARSWAWSGSRWVEHRDGISREAQVSNWDTEAAALEYAREYLLPSPNEEGAKPGKRKLPGR